MHFGHTNILKYCNRPFNTIQDMDRALIKNWNDRVAPNDVVYHLGDFAFASPARISDLLFRALHGRIRLIRGNHDRWIKGFKNENPSKVEWIRDYYEIKDLPERIILFHYPIGSWNKAHHGSIHLHGHSHGNYQFSWPVSSECGKIMDMGVDCNNYSPVSAEEVIERASKLQFRNVDHHGD